MNERFVYRANVRPRTQFSKEEACVPSMRKAGKSFGVNRITALAATCASIRRPDGTSKTVSDTTASVCRHVTVAAPSQSDKASAAACPQRQGLPLRSHVCPLSGASIPCSLIRLPCISIVSPSMTEARPARSGAAMTGAVQVRPQKNAAAAANDTGRRHFAIISAPLRRSLPQPYLRRTGRKRPTMTVIDPGLSVVMAAIAV